jgi:predicted nucleic acid-binding protein
MPPLFVDTGGWLALLRRDDRMHQRARSYYERLVGDGTRLLTTNYVVDETATRLRFDAGLPAALAFRAALDRSTSTGRLRIGWVDPKLEREGWEILEHHADLVLSLMDAVSAAVARRARVQQVFGFDADFRALGFDVQPVA